MGTENDADANAEEFARQILLRQLTDRPRSRAELAAALSKKNVPQSIAADLLDRFENVGLINDEAFARAWVGARLRSRGLAPRAIAVELRQKGIDKDIIDVVLSEIDADDQDQAAVLLVQKKLRTMSSLDEQTKLRRLTAMLARKGYSADVAFAIVRQELQHTDE